MNFLARLLFYPTLLWNLLLNRVLQHWHWWDWIDDQVLLGALPSAGDAVKLRALGIGAVLNLCEEYAGPEAAYASLGLEQLRVRTVDFTAPTLEDIARGLAFMQRNIAAGKKVYVHCKAGRGRSATVVACYLIGKGMTPAEAQGLLNAKRPQVLPGICERAVVLEFYRKNGGR